MQCKDIPDRPVLEFLRDLPLRTGSTGTWFDYEPRPENTVVHVMPDGTPQKLALAKMRMMVRRGVVSGCACGCRGDFELTVKGRQELETA